jgi:hypothetical protein
MNKAIEALNIYCKTIKNNDFESTKLICSCRELYNDNQEQLKKIQKLFFIQNLYKPLAEKMLLNRTVRRFLADLHDLHKIIMIHKDRIKRFRCGLEFGIMYNHITEQYHNEYINPINIRRNKLYLVLTYTHGGLIEKQYYIKNIKHIDELLDYKTLTIIKKHIKNNLLDGYYSINFGRSEPPFDNLDNGFDSDEYIDYSTDFISDNND